MRVVGVVGIVHLSLVINATSSKMILEFFRLFLFPYYYKFEHLQKH